MITSPVGIACLLLFIIAYGFVMAEEFTHFRKSKPVILAATAIWAMIALYASSDPACRFIGQKESLNILYSNLQNYFSFFS